MFGELSEIGMIATKQWRARDELQLGMSRLGQKALQHQISAHLESQEVLEEMGKKVRRSETKNEIHTHKL